MFLGSRLIVGGYLTRARWYPLGRTRFISEKVKKYSLGFIIFYKLSVKL